MTPDKVIVEEDVDYKVIDIIRRHGGVCIIVHIPAIDEDISVNYSEKSFDEAIDYEVTRRIEDSVKRYLPKPQLAMGAEDKVTHLKKMLVGNHKVGEGSILPELTSNAVKLKLVDESKKMDVIVTPVNK